MNEKDFLARNERLKQKQAKIEAERPVRIDNIIPGVLADIRRRQRRTEREHIGGTAR